MRGSGNNADHAESVAMKDNIGLLREENLGQGQEIRRYSCSFRFREDEGAGKTKVRTEVHTGGGAAGAADAVLALRAAPPAALPVLCALRCCDCCALLSCLHHEALLRRLHRPAKTCTVVYEHKHATRSLRPPIQQKLNPKHISAVTRMP